MVGRDARPLRAVHDGRRAALVDDVVARVFEIGALLLPEEEDAEARQERGELVADVLQHLRVAFEGAQQGRVGLEGLAGQGGGGELLEAAGEVRVAGAVVRGAEEDEAVGAGVDGVQVGDFGRGARGGVCEGPFHDDAAEGVAEEDDGARFRAFELGCRQSGPFSSSTMLHVEKEATYSSVSLQIGHQRLRMLQHPIRRRASPLQRCHIGIVTPGQDPGIWHVFGQKVWMFEPADVAFVRRPCREGVAVEAVDGHDVYFGVGPWRV